MTSPSTPPRPEWLAGLAAGSSEILGVIDGQGRLLWLNPAGERALGNAAPGGGLEEALAPGLSPADGERLRACLTRWSAEHGDCGALHVPSPADPARTLELSLRPLGGAPAAGPLGLLFGRDVTDAERGRRAEAQVLGTLERLGQGAAVLAHDVKNPIAALNLALRAVARHLGEDEQGVIQDLVARLVRLEHALRRTVGFARPIEPRPRQVAVGELVEGALAQLAPEARQLGVRLDREVEPGLWLHADPERLGEALVALVQNALEAAAAHPDRGARARIRARALEGKVLLEVEDSGPGLAASVRSRLFQPFVSTKQDGSGLGLALARRLIEAHGGHVEADGSELGGARFRIHLPKGETT